MQLLPPIVNFDYHISGLVCSWAGVAWRIGRDKTRWGRPKEKGQRIDAARGRCMGIRLLPHKAHLVGGIHIQRGSIDAECKELCICVCVCIYDKTKTLEVVSLPLPYFVLDVEGSVISSHLTKFNLFLLCSNDLDLFIELFFFFVFACAVFFVIWFAVFCKACSDLYTTCLV